MLRRRHGDVCECARWSGTCRRIWNTAQAALGGEGMVPCARGGPRLCLKRRFGGGLDARGSVSVPGETRGASVAVTQRLATPYGDGTAVILQLIHARDQQSIDHYIISRLPFWGIPGLPEIGFFYSNYRFLWRHCLIMSSYLPLPFLPGRR